MRHFGLPLAIALFATDVAAMAIDDGAIPGATLVTVGDHDDLDIIAHDIDVLLDDVRRVVLIGSPATLARLRPEWAMVWPTTNTVVLEAATGLGIHGFDAPDGESRLRTLAAWAWAEADEPASRPGRSVSAGDDLRQVDFQLTASSPAQLCRKFTAGLATALSADRTPSADERRAFRREVRRWCQYGNLSSHFAEPPQFTIEPFRGTDVLRLTLTAEWSLVRSEDRADPSKTTYLFWTKTMGEGAGTGFTRSSGSNGHLDRASWEVRGIMDAAIHSGWGPIEAPGVVTAWPLNSTFPYTGDTHVFRCDGPPAFRPGDCPASPILRSLLPADAFDGKVTLSVGESLTVSGEAKLGTSGEKKKSFAMSVAVQAARGMSHGSQLDVALSQVRSNANAIYYRSTWWTPDIGAVYQWLIARDGVDDLSHASPLAATLNPRHDIVWELPLAGNAGRALPYHVVYEAGLNTCNDRAECYGYQAVPAERAKARVGWSDGIVVRLPSR